MPPKPPLAAAQEGAYAVAYIPPWFRVSSLLLLAVAIVLLMVVLLDRVYSPNRSLFALVAVFLALGCATFLHIRAWYEERKGIYATEREFASVCQHALDG